MSKFFVKENQIKNNTVKIIGQDVNHIKNVLRLNLEDQIKICNEDTSENFNCSIKQIEKDEIICEIKEKISSKVESNVEITIFQGLPKADKMELIIQKSTELGASRFVPVALNRCIVKLSGKDAQKKIERWQKISEVAAKQCGRDLIPKIENIENIEEVKKQISDFDLFFVAYEQEKDVYLKQVLQEVDKSKEKIRIAFLIGPEGGLEEKEIEQMKNAGAKIISLGNRILRTETVALSVTSIIMYELENFGG